MIELRWSKGRQGTGYEKLCLLSIINFDVYLLKFPVGISVPIHRDPVPGKEHHRLNIWLRKPLGGQFWTSPTINGNKKFYGRKRFVRFRPDIQWHGMYEVRGKGAAYMLSIGWAK